MLGATIALCFIFPLLAPYFEILFFFEIVLGFLLLSSYGSLIENLRRWRRKIEKEITTEPTAEQK